MEKGPSIIKDILLSIFVIGIAFVLMAFIGTTEFGRKFQVITGESFSSKIPNLVMFTSGCLGTYVFLYKIWISGKENRMNFYFLFGFSLLIILSAATFIMWLKSVTGLIEKDFAAITFPTQVDHVAKNVRQNLLETISYLFYTLSSVGLVCIVVGFYHMKSLKED